MTEVFMPKAGMDMKEGRLIRWLKNVGDPVEKDEPIMEIETDKIAMEAEAPASGILLAVYYENDAIVPVLGVMGYIGDKDETPPQSPQAETEKAPDAAAYEQAETAASAVSETVADGGTNSRGIRATPYARTLAKQEGVDLGAVRATGKHGEICGADVGSAAAPQATPLAKRMAQAENVDLSGLTGSGPNQKICKADVLDALQAGSAGEAAQQPLTIEARKAPTGMQRTIAQRMTQSYTQIPTVTQSILADMTAVMALRQRANEGRESKLTLNDFVLKAAAIAVKEQPKARTVLQGDEFVTYRQANIGFAVSVEDGLLVPVLHDADRLSLSALSQRAKALSAKARSGRLQPQEMTGGVFTVSNMGMYDVWDFTPIINPPEPAILGIGKAMDMLFPAPDGGVTVRKLCKLCLSYDHRIMNGVDAAKITLRIRDLLERPEEMLIL